MRICWHETQARFDSDVIFVLYALTVNCFFSSPSVQFCFPVAVSSAVCRREAKRERGVQLNVLEMWAFKKHCQNVCCVQAWDVSRGVSSCAMFPYWIFRSECWLSPSSFIFFKFLALVGCTSYIGIHIALSLCMCARHFFLARFFSTHPHAWPSYIMCACCECYTDGCWLARSALHTVAPLGCLRTCMWILWLSQPKMHFFNSWAKMLKSCNMFFFFTLWCRRCTKVRNLYVWTSRRVTTTIIKTLFSVMWGADAEFPLFLLYIID